MDNNLTIKPYQLPALKAGNYLLRASQTLQIDKQEKEWAGGKTSENRQWEMVIEGYQFFIPNDQVHVVYPPTGAQGDFSRHLPHIVLKQPTLPWERQPADTTEQQPPTPWLALVVFSEEDLATGAVKQERQEWGEGKEKQVLTRLSIHSNIWQQWKPSPAERRTLAHVRLVDDQAYAVLIGKRAGLAQTTNHIHLVSLEAGQIIEDPEGVTVWSLHSWSFQGEPVAKDQSNWIRQRLEGLSSGLLQVDTTRAPKNMEQVLAQGYTPMVWQPQAAEKHLALYRGPLVPIKPPSGNSEPYQQAMDAWQPESPSEWANASYAVAFGLGQMQAMNDLAFLRDLTQWKNYAQKETENPETEAFWLDVLGRNPVQHPVHTRDQQERQDRIIQWITGIWQLRNIPFSHLLPHPALLPNESLRFFELDAGWLKAMIQGALSPGAGLDFELPKEWDTPRTGYLLRSGLVAGMPDWNLLAALSGQEGLHLPESVVALAPDIQLCIWNGEVTSLEWKQKPATVHFLAAGSEPLNSDWGWRKDQQRNLQHLLEGKENPIAFVQNFQDKGMHWKITLKREP